MAKRPRQPCQGAKQEKHDVSNTVNKLPGSVADWAILREKLRIRHRTPNDRSMEIRYTMQNTSGKSADRIILVLERFLPGLAIRTSTGSELPYLPTWRLAELFGSKAELVSSLAEEFETDVEAVEHVLWIVLPDGVRPDGIVHIALEYQDDLAPSEGAWFVRKPWHAVRETKEPEAFDTYVEIEGPTNSRIAFEADDAMGFAVGEGDDHNEGPWVRKLPRFLQVRMPAQSRDFVFRYRVLPLKSEEAMLWLTYAVTTLLPVLLLILAWTGAVNLRSSNTRIGEIVSGIGIAGVLGVVGFARPSWANRFWFALPLLAYLGLLSVSFK